MRNLIQNEDNTEDLAMQLDVIQMEKQTVEQLNIINLAKLFINFNRLKGTSLPTLDRNFAPNEIYFRTRKIHSFQRKK